MNFKNLQTTKLGEAAEHMVGKEFCQSKGYIPYVPAVDASHPVDFIAMSGASIFNLDVKCKSRMVYYPLTGIDKKDVNKYLTYAYPTYLLFVDIATCSVYGQWLQVLIKEPHTIFPGRLNKEDVMTWGLTAMTHYRYLTETECEELKSLESGNYR